MTFGVSTIDPMYIWPMSIQTQFGYKESIYKDKDGVWRISQIKQQELTIEKARQDYDQLVKHSLGDKSIANYQIALAEATLTSLKNLRDNQKFINLN